MATLLDIIQNRMTEAPPAAAAAPELGATAQAGNLIRTKLTGKAGAGPGAGTPAASNIGEQAVAQQAGAQATQLNQQGQLAAEGLAGQAATVNNQAQLQSAQEQNNRKLKQQQFSTVSQGILQDAARQGKQLDTTSDINQLEQVSFGLRLNNDQYVNELQTAAAKQGIDNATAFNEQYYKQVFGDQLDALRGKLDMQDLMSADDREFTQKMSTISVQDALDIAKLGAREKSAEMGYTGLGSLVSGGLKGYETYNTPAAPAAPAEVANG